jgi:hypothetical protein
MGVGAGGWWAAVGVGLRGWVVGFSRRKTTGGSVQNKPRNKSEHVGMK